MGAVSGTAMQAAKDMILGIVKEPEVGEVTGRCRRSGFRSQQERAAIATLSIKC